MHVIALDPGGLSGIAVYDSETRRVLYAEVISDPEELVASARFLMGKYTPYHAVIERVRAYGIAGKEIADACELTGWVAAHLGTSRIRETEYSGKSTAGAQMSLLTRQLVSKRIGLIEGARVSGPRVWQAVVRAHGGKDALAPGGALHLAEAADHSANVSFGKSGADHARAAVSLAVAYCLGETDGPKRRTGAAKGGRARGGRARGSVP